MYTFYVGVCVINTTFVIITRLNIPMHIRRQNVQIDPN